MGMSTSPLAPPLEECTCAHTSPGAEMGHMGYTGAFRRTVAAADISMCQTPAVCKDRDACV